MLFTLGCYSLQRRMLAAMQLECSYCLSDSSSFLGFQISNFFESWVLKQERARREELTDTVYGRYRFARPSYAEGSLINELLHSTDQSDDRMAAGLLLDRVHIESTKKVRVPPVNCKTVL